VLLVLHGGVNCAILSLALTGQRLFLGGLAQTAGCINALDVGERTTSDWVVRFVNHSPPSRCSRHAQHHHGTCCSRSTASRAGEKIARSFAHR
jgi:hypothetical protein